MALHQDAHWRSNRGEEQFEMHETMSGKAPVILGGHEHTIFEEESPGLLAGPLPI